MSNGPNNYIELRQQRDFSAVISTGFSRGSISTSYVGLYNDLIADH